MTAIPEGPKSDRLSLEPFGDDDAEALAAILLDPEITRNITANATNPETALACARKRISWHNGAWADEAYGVWAVKARDDAFTAAGRLLGWCGFVPPDVGTDPEILYGLSRDCWGSGLATEAATAAIDWLFSETRCGGVSAVIFGRLNFGSLKVTEKLGMTRRGVMEFADFLPEADLAQQVLDYEIWRLGAGDCLDAELLLFQVPFKAGQIVSTGLAEPQETLDRIVTAARRRSDFKSWDPTALDNRIGDSLREGISNSDMDWYHLTKESWLKRRRGEA